MSEEAKGDSMAVEDPLNYIIEVMRKNEAFLRQNAEETYQEVVELINEAIDYVVFAAKKSGEDYVQWFPSYIISLCRSVTQSMWIC